MGDTPVYPRASRYGGTSDDFVNDIVTIIPEGFESVKSSLITGDVSIGDMCAVGSNSVIMPDNMKPDGVAIGALSFVCRRAPFQGVVRIRRYADKAV